MSPQVLNRTDLSTLNKGLSAISDTRALLDKAKAAGFDVSNHEQTLQYLEQRYNQMKQLFFPGAQ